jgi:hypothetical protein
VADITPTQAIVKSGRVETVTLGEAVTVLGQLLRFDSLLGQYVLANAGATVAETTIRYMALELGIKDDPIRVLTPGGVVDLGAVLTPAMDYALSVNAGRIGLYSDLVSTNYAVFAGIAQTSSELIFSVLNSRTTVP